MGPARFAVIHLLAPVVQTQSVVSPTHFTQAEGTGYSNAGLGDTQTPSRFLQLHDDLAGPPRTISRLSLRRDGSLVFAYPSRNVVIDLFVSTGATNAGTPNPSFDANHGANKVQLATFKQVQLPETVNGTLPRPFEYQIPFDQPFSYDGLGPLCWELKVQARQHSGAIYLDWVSGSDASPAMQATYLGTGCKSVDHTSAMQHRAAYSTMNWSTGGGTISYSASYAPNNSLQYIMVGTSESSFLGVPLPFEFAPASAPSGRCVLYNNIVVLVPAFSTATGTVSLNVGVPATLDFHGGHIFSQMLAFEPAANAAGVITSNMVVLNWVAPFGSVPMGQVSLGGSLAGTGTARANAGFIVRFE